MAGTVCTATVQLCGLRVAKLEPNGVPKPGAGNLYVTDQQIDFGIEVELEAGADIVQKNGCDLLCAVFRSPDKLKRVNVSLTLCTPEPELTQLLVPGGLLLTTGGNTRGFAYPAIGADPSLDGVSLEAWVRNITGGAPHPTLPFIRFVLPRAYMQIGPKTLQNDAINHPFTGWANENSNWFNGPANDWPYSSARVAAYAFDTAVPTPVCGAQTLIAS